VGKIPIPIPIPEYKHTLSIPEYKYTPNTPEYKYKMEGNLFRYNYSSDEYIMYISSILVYKDVGKLTYNSKFTITTFYNIIDYLA
jgi:hypothetical protein